MKTIKHVKIGRLCLMSFCLMAVFALGAAGSASAASLLFVPHSGTYPYHAAGTGGEAKLVTVGGNVVTAEKTDVLAVALNATLVDLKIEFLKVSENLIGSPCKNDGKPEAILVSLLAHLGFADPGNKPAVLALVPSGFEFECAGGFAKVKVRGAVIGEITSPGLGVASESLTVAFKQSKGIQALKTFLMGNETLTEQFEQSSLDGKEFEQSAQSGEGVLKALAGQGTFLLVSP